jgi:hypothetical protein
MPFEALGWSLVIIVLLLAAFAGVMYLRKWLREPDEPSEASTFTLGDLRRYLREGKLTQEEYDRLRGQIVAVAKKDTRDPLEGRKPKPPGIPPGSGDSGRPFPPSA